MGGYNNMNYDPRQQEGKADIYFYLGNSIKEWWDKGKNNFMKMDAML